MLIEIEPCFGIALRHLRPVDDVEYAQHRVERGDEHRPLLIGEQAQRDADQRVGLAQFLRHIGETFGQLEAARLCHQKPERHRLCVSVGELFVIGFGEQQPAPVVAQFDQRLAAAFHLFDHLVAQEAAEPRRDLRQLARIARRGWFPCQKVVDQCQKAGGSLDRAAVDFDVARQLDDLTDQLPVAPQRKPIAIAIDQVRQRLQPLPLRLVVLVLETARVGTLARRLDLDKAHQRIVHRDRIVGPGFQVGERCFADHMHLRRRRSFGG